MDRQSTQPRKAQLDKEEREHLEDIVTEMRDRVEANVRYQLEEHGLEDRPDEDASLNDEKKDLVQAIELEAVDGNEWDEGYEQYITGVGYTIVNRLAALRCMEVRDFVDEEVTVFRGDGLTPAADRLVNEEFMLEEEAVLEAYRDACDDLAEEIGILFDRSTAYSPIDPDDDTYEDLCEMLDKVPNEVWRADDVLGWVYEYYNTNILSGLRKKAKKSGLDPEDVSPANQFYTPHWVVRMLTDNSLGKLYLENTSQLESTIAEQESLTSEERKNRPLPPDESPTLGDFCTYLVPSEEEGEASEFDHPAEIKILDPACGSGHFLLYAFDVLERIWRAETQIDPAEIPHRILEENLYGVDLDMRACQLAAFNLYLKSRTRTELEGSTDFQMPELGIVCADAKVANVEGVDKIFDEVVSSSSSIHTTLSEEDVGEALENILNAFEDIHGLGSLLDVRGTLGEMFNDNSGGIQLTIEDDFTADYTLSSFLHTLHDAISAHRDTDSFLAQDLKSFVHLLDVLAQDYDVTLMNPPYGAQKRMPDQIKQYVESHYDYSPEFYINFFELCDRVTKPGGRIGMLVPRSFMFKRSFEQFRADFIGERGAFDFLAEFGLGILDNATVRTVGTVVRTGNKQAASGTFLRLYDIESSKKERIFTQECLSDDNNDIDRIFDIPLSEFEAIPRSPLNYAIPSAIRELHRSELKLEYEEGDNEAVCEIAQGLSTGDNPRFIRQHWEAPDLEYNYPYAKGGSDAWITPDVDKVVQYRENGREMRPLPGSVLRNTQYYGKEGLTWTYIKSTGRRFGYLPEGCIFDHSGSMVFPSDEIDPWILLSVLNTDLYHSLFLSLSPDRHWTPGIVSRVPWFEQFNNLEELGDAARNQYELKLREEIHDPASPFYIGPEIIADDALDGFFFEYHPFTDFAIEDWDLRFEGADPDQSLEDVAQQASYEESLREYKIEQIADEIETSVSRELGISQDTHRAAEAEIELRTAEQIGKRVTEPPSQPATDEISDNFQNYIKKLVHHVVIEQLTESDDGIIPLREDSENPRLLQELEQGFNQMYGEYTGSRLREVDQALGTRTADDRAYPNIEEWLEQDLFEYHLQQMENNPLFWYLTSERTVPDPSGEGFSCIVDYHEIDQSVFDRISNHYLEPRKSALRNKRESARERQSDQSLSTKERSEATDKFERCSSGIEQISEFENVIQELAQSEPRNWSQGNQQLAAELANKVEKFREETQDLLNILDTMSSINNIDMGDRFSPTFYSTVQEQREEWVNGLKEIERSCDALSKNNSELLEAHHYDMLQYFDDLIGSTHFASNGILFMTYYFEDGKEYLKDGEIPEGLNKETQLLAELANNIQDYIDSAKYINDNCGKLIQDLSSDWEQRALTDIKTGGYQPNKKYGVSVNIKPISEKKIVPEIVDEKVL